MRDDHGAADIETELIAPQWGFVLAVLLHFVRYGIENVVTEIFIKAAVPEQSRATLSLRGRRTFRAHAPSTGQHFEFFSHPDESERKTDEGVKAWARDLAERTIQKSWPECLDSIDWDSMVIETEEGCSNANI